MSLLSDILKDIPLSAVLREKISAIETENAQLKTEIAILKDDLRQAQAENQRLKNTLQELAHVEELDESKILILKALAKYPVILAPEFYSVVQMERVQLDYHLQQLLELQYVLRRKPQITRPARYSLSQKGRQYVLENQLTAD
jgi:hypothetical protein